MKHLLWIALGLAFTAVVAGMTLRQVEGDPHLNEVVTAGVIALVSAELSMVPIMLVRRMNAVAHFQAAFGGTVIHLFLTFALGAAASVLHLVPDRQLFLFMLLAFYSVSLVFVVAAMLTLFRRAAASHPGVPTTHAAAKSS